MILRVGDFVLITGGPLVGASARFLHRLPSGITVTLDENRGAYKRGDQVSVGNGEVVPRRHWRRLTDHQRIAYLKAVAAELQLSFGNVSHLGDIQEAALDDQLLFGGVRDQTLSTFVQNHLADLVQP
jgi:hypothetical protein